MLTRVQVRDQGDELHFSADLPGVAPENLRISFEQDTLVIRGERAAAPEGFALQRKERDTRGFAQAFTLPVRVDVDKIDAQLRNGILELRLPKAAEERRRNIMVKAA
jgi:HSP20 family protein